MPGMIERVALDALLLRTQLPELSLREGTSVVARVASRGEGHGVIVLAGVPLTAQLPPEVQAGQTLHLRIAEVTPEQVTMRLEPQSLAPPAAPPPPAPLEQRPARVTVEEPPRRGAGGEESASVALSFDSAVLGRVDLRIDLARGIVSAGIAAAPGAPFELATGAAGRLESALSAKTGRAARVRVMPRREPFDAYA
jgi:hypothetical protein